MIPLLLTLILPDPPMSSALILDRQYRMIPRPLTPRQPDCLPRLPERLQRDLLLTLSLKEWTTASTRTCSSWLTIVTMGGTSVYAVSMAALVRRISRGSPPTGRQNEETALDIIRMNHSDLASVYLSSEQVLMCLLHLRQLAKAVGAFTIGKLNQDTLLRWQ
jgi:hypothetical protein